MQRSIYKIGEGSKDLSDQIKRSRIVIFTATDLEDEIFRSEAALSGLTYIENNFFDGISFSTFAVEERIHVLHVRTSAGSGGVHGSGHISTRFLEMPGLDYAISTGICFGSDRDKQKFGDVIFADSVYPYDHAAVRGGTLEFRGTPIPTDASAVSYGRSIRASLGGKIGTHIGAILSGDKLVDDPDFKREIFKFNPRAVGGEMECAGLSTAAQGRGVPFAMIKGICDFAENKDDKYQEIAATNAIRLTLGFVRSRWGGEDAK